MGDGSCEPNAKPTTRGYSRTPLLPRLRRAHHPAHRYSGTYHVPGSTECREPLPCGMTPLPCELPPPTGPLLWLSSVGPTSVMKTCNFPMTTELWILTRGMCSSPLARRLSSMAIKLYQMFLVANGLLIYGQETLAIFFLVGFSFVKRIETKNA